MASHQYAVQVLEAYHKILNSISHHHELEIILEGICDAVDAIFDAEHAKSTIQLLTDHRLTTVAGPKLPKYYIQAIEGASLGPTVGSFGRAVFLNQQVIVADINHDPLWEGYRDIVQQSPLVACWSTPVADVHGEIIACFSIYYDMPRVPNDDELDILARVTQLIALAIARANESSQNKRLLTDLKRVNDELEAIARVLPDLAFINDSDGYYRAQFGGEDELLIQPTHSFIDKHISEVLPNEVVQIFEKAFAKVFTTGQMQIVEYPLQLGRKECFFEARITELKDYDIKNQNRRYALTLVREITERKRNEERTEKLAFYDPLTGLPNRRLFLERAKMLREDIIRNNTYAALLFIDLDRFKAINDGEGHNKGDIVLKDISEKLNNSLRSNDTLARHGGDEFVVLLGAHQTEEAITKNDARTVAQKLLAAIKEPYTMSGNHYRLGASIGIAVFDGSINDIETIIRNADKAMYRAKQKGGNGYHFASY